MNLLITTTIFTLLCFIPLEDCSLSSKGKKVILMPWMGVLMYKSDNDSLEEVTNIVMIEYRIAIGNAKEIGAVSWDSLKKSSKAMFYHKGKPWFCRLVGNILHPEYEQGNLNTIVILFLENVADPRVWKPIRLISTYKEVSRWTQVFNVGYRDNRFKLEQEIYPMDYVSRTTCEEFYFREEINFDFLWPPNAICYTAMNSKKSCVISSGMALVSNYTEGWILMGLSTHGPGCSVPARYIELFPYVKWIKDKTEVRKSTRRSSYYHEAIHTAYGYKAFIDLFFANLHDKSIAMERWRANYTETVQGCYYPEDTETIMYKEEDVFTTQSPVGIGVFALLIFDTNFESVTCVKLYTMCKARSVTKFYTYARTHSEENNSPFTKAVPARVRDYVRNNSYMLITDPHYIQEVDTHHMQFKFTFDKIAKINVTFYGKFNGTW